MPLPTALSFYEVVSINDWLDQAITSNTHYTVYATVSLLTPVEVDPTDVEMQLYFLF